MSATRTLTAAVFALVLTAGLSIAQTPPPGSAKLPAGIKKTDVKLAQNPALKNGGLKIPDSIKDRLNAADLAVTDIKIGANNAVVVTVKNVGRSATTKPVKLFLGSSGTGNLDNLADSQMLSVPVMAAGEVRVFQSTDPLVQRARDEVDGAGVIFLAANVDKLEEPAEPSEANNFKIITAK
jgi:hypothetical protein